MIENFKKILNINGIWAFVVIFITLTFYSIKFYKQGELVFIQHQFGFFIGFFLIVVLGFCCVIYQNVDLKKDLIVMSKKLEVSNEAIMRFLKVLDINMIKNNDANVEMHRNTRSVVLACLDEYYEMSQKNNE